MDDKTTYYMDKKIKEYSCETCKWGEWYRQGYDITMMNDECGGCCSWNNKYKLNEVLENGKEKI